MARLLAFCSAGGPLVILLLVALVQAVPWDPYGRRPEKGGPFRSPPPRGGNDVPSISECKNKRDTACKSMLESCCTRDANVYTACGRNELYCKSNMTHCNYEPGSYSPWTFLNNGTLCQRPH